jgi:hypothetical protein
MAEEFVVNDQEGLTAISRLRRRGQPSSIIGRFSTAMAAQARLNQRIGPWQDYPQRCLMMRARSWALRDGFADVLRGLQISEEVADYTDISRARPPMIDRPRLAMPDADFRGHEKTSVLAPEPGMSLHTATAATIAEATNPLTQNPSPSSGRDSFCLVDAESGFIEVHGVTALRAAFEQLLGNPELSGDQVLGLWESNVDARHQIDRWFGTQALEAVAGRVDEASRARNEGDRLPSVVITTPLSSLSGTRAQSRRGGRSTLKPSDLTLEIDPSWSEAAVFQQYHGELRRLRQGGRGKAATIAAFRAVNQDIEEGLRTKLPQEIKKIDAIYAWAARHAR